MSEHSFGAAASIVHLPEGRSVVSEEGLQGAAALRGYQPGPLQLETRSDYPQTADHIAFVGARESGSLHLEPGKKGLLGTHSLAGCTGVAAFARHQDGSVDTLISHYGHRVNTRHYNPPQENPANQQLQNFISRVNEDVHKPPRVDVLVAYEAALHRDPDYGKRNGQFKDWEWLEQIVEVASGLSSDNVRVLFLPYKELGNTLAAGRRKGHEGIFWNGTHVDFNAYLSGKSAHDRRRGRVTQWLLRKLTRPR